MAGGLKQRVLLIEPLNLLPESRELAFLRCVGSRFPPSSGVSHVPAGGGVGF